MKKHFTWASAVMLILTLFSSSLMQAQMRRMSPEDQAKMLKEKLQLTDDQTKKITSILEDSREETTTARAQANGNRDSMRAAMQDLMKRTGEKIKAVLTEDQAKQFDVLQKERQEQMMKHRKAVPDSTK